MRTLDQESPKLAYRTATVGPKGEFYFYEYYEKDNHYTWLVPEDDANRLLFGKEAPPCLLDDWKRDFLLSSL